MRKILYALILASAFIIPATAQAQTLPPGYTSETAFEDAPMFGTQKDCAHGRAKLLRWHLTNYAGTVVAKHNVKLAVCARDGHVYWYNRVDRVYDQSGTKPGDRWYHNGQVFKTGGRCCGNEGRYVHSTQLWVFRGVIDQYWQSDLHIRAHVGGPGRGPNDIWFSKWSRFQ